MSYQLYRNTTLGNTLQESLDELIQVCRSCSAAAYRYRVNDAAHPRIANAHFAHQKLHTSHEFH